MGIAINFDTLEISKELEKAGFSQQQAETITKIQKQVISDNLDNTIATKTDIARIEHSLELLKYMVGINIAILIALAMKFIFN